MPIPKSLSKKLPKARGKVTEPLWKGPEVDGVTQSMLNKFEQCRERFRVKYMLGLEPADTFIHRIEYGNMWHICEEHADGDWQTALKKYAMELAAKYRTQQEAVEKWYQVCKMQFPIYCDYWKNHKGAEPRKVLLTEEEFNVPYELPDGCVVKLRGKWDDVSLLGEGKARRLSLGENKTKGEILPEKVARQLTFDRQTMLYATALQLHVDSGALKGLGLVQSVYYNVVRRPLSGGKHTIKPLQGKTYKTKPSIPAETAPAFYTRLGKLIASDPEFFFMRWPVDIFPDDMERFKIRYLNPILGQLVDWYGRVSRAMRAGRSVFDNKHHWQTPYGGYNVLAEGGSTDLDEYLATGSQAGLVRVNKLFRELG